MNPNLFNKVFTGLVFFLSLFYAFWLGVDVTRGDTKEIIADAVLLGFWLFALAFIVAMNRHERKFKQELETAEKNLHHKLGDLFGELERDIKEQQARREAFTGIFKEVTGKEFEEATNVSARHKTAIQKRFNEVTGLHAEIAVHKGGKIEVEVSKEKPTVKKAPVKKTAARKVAEVKVPPVPAKKVTTKKGNK